MLKPEIAKRHVRPGETVTQGMLGCAHSHIDLLYRALKGGMDELYVFEDDCQITGPPAALEGWVGAMRGTGIPWDMLLLGANEYVEAERGILSPSQEGAAEETRGERIAVQRVGRFWGTHAMVIRPRAAQAALKVFADAQKQGVFLPADWMWNEAIRQGGLLVFGPPEPTTFCRQAPGLVSAITGTVRLGLI